MKYTSLLPFANLIVSSFATLQLETSNIVDFNVTRSSYHIEVSNSTEFEQWSLSNMIVPDLEAHNGTAINVAVIGDGINDKYLTTTNVTVHDVISNSTFLFTNDEITQDTLSAIILLNNSPSTKLTSFKIFEDLTSTTSLTGHLVDAIQLALSDESIDLVYINTWQSYGGWSNSELSIFLNKAAQTKPIVMPMGQSFGMFQMSDGASASDVISVGGSGFDGTMGYPLLIDDQYYGYYSKEKLNLYPNNTLVLGELDHQCMLVNNVSYDESDLLFIDVGNCTSDQVVNAVSMSNFTQLLTVGNEYQLYNFTEDSGVTSAMLGESSGSEILSKLQAHEYELIAHPSSTMDTQILLDYKFDEFSINFNSSMGPTLDLQLKPNILAQSSYYFPDLNVFASGTAFSAAYVVGIISLFASTNENWNIGLVDRITSSGILTNFRNMTEVLDDTVQNPVVQGGGILNDFDFIHKSYSTNPSFFNLGENQVNDTEVAFTLTNDDSGTKKFFISGVESITLYSQDSYVDPDGDSIYDHPIYGNETRSELIIDRNVVILKPGKSANVTAAIHIPDYSSELNRIPIFGGYIEVLDVNTGIVSNLPYFGTSTKMNDIETQTDAEFYWKEFHYEGKYRPCETWVDGSVINDTNHFLQIYWNDRIGSPMVDILVVDKDWTNTDFVYPPISGENKFIDRIKGTRLPSGYPWLNVPRTNVTAVNQWDDWHYGLLDDDSILDDGEYRILLLILKHNYQNVSDLNDWYSHLSPYFVQNYINLSEVIEPTTTVSLTHLTTLKTSSLTATTTTSMLMDMDGMKM